MEPIHRLKRVRFGWTIACPGCGKMSSAGSRIEGEFTMECDGCGCKSEWELVGEGDEHRAGDDPVHRTTRDG